MEDFIKLALDNIQLSKEALAKAIVTSPDPLTTLSILTNTFSTVIGRKEKVMQNNVLVSVKTIAENPHPFTLTFPIIEKERKTIYLWILPSQGIETENDDTFNNWIEKSKEYSALSTEEMKALRATQPEDNRLTQKRVYGPWLEKPNYLTEDWNALSNYQ